VRAHKLCEEARRQPVNLCSKTSEGEAPLNLCGHTSCARRRDVSLSTCARKRLRGRRRSTCAGSQVVRGGETSACQLATANVCEGCHTTCAVVRVDGRGEASACQLATENVWEGVPYNLCSCTCCWKRRGVSLSICDRKRLGGSAVQLARLRKFAEDTRTVGMQASIDISVT